MTTADYKNRLVRLGGIRAELLDLQRSEKNYDPLAPRRNQEPIA